MTATLPASGRLQLPLPIPNAPGLHGATIDLQLGVGDPVVLTIDLSRGLETVVR